MKKYKPKDIICPSCGQKAGTWDGRSTTDRMVKCEKCRKSVIYRTATRETENRPLPKRNCSSGMAFV